MNVVHTLTSIISRMSLEGPFPEPQPDKHFPLGGPYSWGGDTFFPNSVINQLVVSETQMIHLFHCRRNARSKFIEIFQMHIIMFLLCLLVLNVFK